MNMGSVEAARGSLGQAVYKFDTTAQSPQPRKSRAGTFIPTLTQRLHDNRKR